MTFFAAIMIRPTAFCFVNLVLLLGVPAHAIGQSSLQFISVGAEPNVNLNQLKGAMLWVQCSSSGRNEIRGASYGLDRIGWQGMVHKHIRPITDWYGRTYGEPMRVMLHLPFGFEKTKDQPKMNFLAYVESRRAGTDFFTKDFAQHIRPLVREGHEVVAYIGSPHNSAEFVREIDDPERHDEIIRKSWASVREPINAGCSIAFDNMSSLARTRESEQAYWKVKSLGIKTYIEATLERHPRNEAFWQEPAFITFKLFQSRHSEKQNPGAVGRFPRFDEPDFYPNEVIVLISMRDHKSAHQQAVAANQVHRWGATPALTITGWNKLRKRSR